VIVTFYSFKGGTGRTTALANIAILLAKAGNRVLVVDFDLEAPGLWRFFQSQESGLDRRDGLLDLLNAQVQRSQGMPIDWREFVVPVRFDGGWISLMTSGRSDDGYPARVLGFNWQDFFRYQEGGPFIEHLRAEWSKEYDFTLIDSRTGITDTGGVCTIALPDMIVPVFVANHQNIEGVIDVLRRAQAGRQALAYDRAPALVLPVLSRFDGRTEYEAAEKWLKQIADKLGFLYADWLPDYIEPRQILEKTKLPYVGYFSFGESLPVLEQGITDPESLGYALNSVSQLIGGHLANAAAIATGSDPSRLGRNVARREEALSPPASPAITTPVAADSLLRIPAIMGGVPPLNPDFTGREEMLQELHRELRRQSRTTVLPRTIQGLGGVGKSQLAVEYARRFQADYDLIWWIPSDGELSVQRSLVSLARRLALPEADDMTYTVERVLDQLRSGLPTSNWLLIYDGAGEPRDLREYLPSGSGHVLITSRSRSWVSQSSIIELDVFTPEESVAFLTRRWGDISLEDAERLADELGHLPLALEQAAAVHSETGMPLAEYLRLLIDSPGRVLADGLERSVTRTYHLAFSQLSEQSPAAAQLLAVCSFLSSNPIAVGILVRGRGAPLPAALSDALHDDMKIRQAVRSLGRYALAQSDAGGDFITIHKLVRALVRDGLTGEEYAATQQAAHGLLALATPGAPDNKWTWAQHAEVAPHVVPSGIIMSRDPHVLRTVLDQTRYLFVIGNYSQSLTLAELAAETWTESFGPDNELTLAARLHVGHARRALGEYTRAREINQGALQRAQRVLGLDHEQTLHLANSYGADLRLLGDFGQALDVDAENLERCRGGLGDLDPATLRSANNLAVDYRLIGRYSQALEMDQDTWRKRANALGDNNPEMLSSTTSMTSDFYDLGEYERALALEEESLAKYEPLLPSHIFILTAMRNLAMLTRKVGNYVEAVRLSTATFELSRDRVGPMNELTLSAMITLCNALREAGDLTKALRMGEDVQERYRAQFGPEHPFTLASANNLSIVYRSLGNVQDAGALDDRTLEALERILGRDHPYTLCCACNTANNLAMTGRHAEAQQTSEQVFERSRRLRGPDHPYTLACAGNLSIDLDATGATAEAATLRRDVLDGMRQRFGLEHPDIVNFERGRRAECDIEVPKT
jgi:cellulose biosynthesis protein BcsQ/tetratricopeptide (TPR) repeat protein